MRGRIRWVGAAVVASAAIGGAAAIINTPVPSSGAASISRTSVAPAPERDVVTPQISALAAQAQQLGSEIAAAQGELSHLQQEVAYEATLSQQRFATTTTLRAPVTHPSSKVSVTTTTHHESTTTTRATTTTTIAPTTMLAPTTTQATTTTTTVPMTITTVCGHHHGDQPPGSSATGPTTNCYGGGGNDN